MSCSMPPVRTWRVARRRRQDQQLSLQQIVVFSFSPSISPRRASRCSSDLSPGGPAAASATTFFVVALLSKSSWHPSKLERCRLRPSLDDSSDHRQQHVAVLVRDPSMSPIQDIGTVRLRRD